MYLHTTMARGKQSVRPFSLLFKAEARKSVENDKPLPIYLNSLFYCRCPFGPALAKIRFCGLDPCGLASGNCIHNLR